MENRERSLIKIISDAFPRSEMQLNKLNESDAEIVMFGGKRMFVNVDEFSAEDMFRENDPYTLGWNIAIGAVSDIFASGGEPVFYAHGVVVKEEWDEKYIKEFSRGAADVVRMCGAALIGGDFGIAGEWRYTAVVIGQGGENVMLRTKAKAGDSIYVTGKIGAGNFEAFLNMLGENIAANMIKNRFNLRKTEAAIIREYSKCCIDTSDGLFNGLNTIAEMSGTGYIAENIPYIKAGIAAAAICSMDRRLMFLGEAGEYELLFTISKEREEEFLKRAIAEKLTFYKIGKITEEKRNILIDNGENRNLTGMRISARDFKSRREYIERLNSNLLATIQPQRKTGENH